MNHTVETARFHWHWRQFGRGTKLLFAFHGFNRTSDDFHSFEKWLGEHYTIIAFDLLYHGKSVLKGNEPMPAFTMEELKEVLELVLNRYEKSKFSVIAHSFGGRLALNCVEIFKERVQELFLMAPDAMRFNPAYWFATQTLAGRLIMRKFSQNPRPIVKLMHLLPKIGLFSDKAMEFYINQISYEPIRQKVYKIWMAHRRTVVKRLHVFRLIKKNKTPVLLFFGKYDTIITPSLGIRFAKNAGPSATLHLIETGHRLHEKHHEICTEILALRK